MPDYKGTWKKVAALLKSAYAEITSSRSAMPVSAAAPQVLNGTEEEFLHFLDHNELELAWDTLAEMGELGGGRSFWNQLAQAAQEMRLSAVWQHHPHGHCRRACGR